MTRTKWIMLILCSVILGGGIGAGIAKLDRRTEIPDPANADAGIGEPADGISQDGGMASGQENKNRVSGNPAYQNEAGDKPAITDVADDSGQGLDDGTPEENPEDIIEDPEMEALF